ncbi:CopD family protein [Mucilaginibacter lappiensis]|uniref:Protoporphyrinogen IX oxidase n=1 Tax=Mucilaginibacter lappiensis TaxID=354630 RepID=A0A841JA10_9SPHI|nr:CopD family protein [Mucilaginibacter lappiensis]MBB6127999.1 putative membrane protein [Mucilaginibacter lappiensis]
MYDYVKAVHIIFVVCYMAGLFYSVRLFIYHTEAQEKPEPDRKILSDQFTIMERKLWNIITIPSMILTVAAGITMLIMRPIWLHFGWMHLKLTFVVVLGVYHHMCQNKIKQMANGVFKWTSTQLRLWNELATLLLFAIVFLVVLKSALNWIFGVVGLVALAMILMIAVKIYKRYRTKKQ